MNCYKASVLVTAIGSVNWTMPAFPETLCVSLSQPQALVPSKVTTILTFILMISLCVCVFLIVELKLDMFVSPHLPSHISALFKKHGSFLFLIVHLLKNVGYLCCSVSHRLDLADCWLQLSCDLCMELDSDIWSELGLIPLIRPPVALCSIIRRHFISGFSPFW